MAIYQLAHPHVATVGAAGYRLNTSPSLRAASTA
jgi:hypothetical protein